MACVLISTANSTEHVWDHTNVEVTATMRTYESCRQGKRWKRYPRSRYSFVLTTSSPSSLSFFTATVSMQKTWRKRWENKEKSHYQRVLTTTSSPGLDWFFSHWDGTCNTENLISTGDKVVRISSFMVTVLFQGGSSWAYFFGNKSIDMRIGLLS